MENSEATLQQVKHIVVICSNKSTIRCIPKRTEIKDLNKYLYTKVHINTIKDTRRWKQHKHPPTDKSDKSRNKLWYMHIMGYYSALEINKILTHATT